MCHCLTVFGQAMLFDQRKNNEDTASPKTPARFCLRLKKPSSFRVMRSVRGPDEYQTPCFPNGNSKELTVPMLRQRLNRF